MQQVIVSVIMGVLLIIDELFDMRSHTLTEDYIAMVIAVVWPLLIWLTQRVPIDPPR